MMQVIIEDITPGGVTITVTAHTLPFPQPYALAVLGDFDGDLESADNPGWDGATRAPCSVPVVNITSGPAGISPTGSAAFTFNATQGTQLQLNIVGPPGTPCQAVFQHHIHLLSDTLTENGLRCHAAAA